MDNIISIIIAVYSISYYTNGKRIANKLVLLMNTFYLNLLPCDFEINIYENQHFFEIPANSVMKQTTEIYQTRNPILSLARSSIFIFM